MKTLFLGHVAVCALATTLLTVGCNPGGQSRIASAGSRAPDAAKAAAEYAVMGQAAMRGRNGPLAVAMAEQAVAARPDMAQYRAQLGQSYLLAGRFASAIDAFRDTIALTPGDGRVLLGMALAQGALDRQTAAQASVAAAAGKIGDADRGLALALAGQSDAAIALLEPAARVADAVPKTRQNLALAYALAGQWDKARATAAQDLSGADLDGRMAKWAQLARPQARVDRVANFLGVTPVAIDEGMPMRLALGTTPAAPTIPKADVPTALAAAEPAPPVAAPEPVVVAMRPEPEPAPVVVAMTTEAVADTGPAFVAVRADPKTAPASPALLVRRQTMPTAAPAMLMRANYVAPVPRRGLWAVQLGAFSSGRSIEAAWERVSRTVHPVAGMMPLSSTIRARGMLFQRLAVGGLGSRGEATALCEQVRAAQGVCFVRTTTDETPMRMAARSVPVRVASR